MTNLYSEELQQKQEQLIIDQKQCEGEQDYDMEKNLKRSNKNCRVDSTGWRKNLRNILDYGEGNGQS